MLTALTSKDDVVHGLREADTDVTMYPGVATYHEDIKNEDEIFKMAHDALYESKSRGRKLVVTCKSQYSSASSTDMYTA